MSCVKNVTGNTSEAKNTSQYLAPSAFLHRYFTGSAPVAQLRGEYNGLLKITLKKRGWGMTPKVQQ